MVKISGENRKEEEFAMTDMSTTNNMNNVYDHGLLFFIFLLCQKDSLLFIQNKNI